MNTTYFQGLTIKINQIVDYLATKMMKKLEIFSNELNDKFQINKISYGNQIKKAFQVIQAKDVYLTQILETFNDQEKNIFILYLLVYKMKCELI